jgi:glutamate-ammonia-ligase adenylyltransferase
MNDAGVETTLGELTTVAEVCLQQMLDAVSRDAVARPAEQPPLAVIGLGKLGGRELHYNSDLDVMFVGEAAASTSDEEHALPGRLAERLLAQVAEAPRGEGPPFLIDARLRPEGQSGPLVRSIDSCAEYYGRWAQPWERMALIRARPVAGDRATARAFLDAVAPFLWADGLSAAELEAILHAKDRIERERARTKDGAVDIKLGPGSINDIEFCVQLSQLAHGARDASVRPPGTLPALRALGQRGWFPRNEDAALLEAAYLFLRQVECRLQIVHDWDESTIEPGTGGFGKLARLLEYDDGESASAAERLATDLHRHQTAARDVFERTVQQLRQP